MRDMTALAPFAIVAAVVGATLLSLQILVWRGVTQVIVPPPDTTTEQFLRAIQARRFSGATTVMSEGLTQQIREGELKILTDDLERSGRALTSAHGAGFDRQDDRASARATVRTRDGQERTLEFPLVREKGEWKIASVDPLRELLPR